ncbi:Serine dehydratase, single chain form [Paracholeplasma brassicae]|uniref:L-serine ammonia-lyase n=1 Tax=Acholeplasma brassicae TaxID=61635 RepID=U4KPH3_9MOLU|nr:L-serine ammonia-lyase, iron-sulfur-dependent, subunit alpha [Paracholeplasma brassicae]CCV66265.1 Serine dehydratase, single chain form [Paracholeplasma brassicae]
MQSIKHLFKVGHGPSSSHTMGPAFAAQDILDKYKQMTHVEVTLLNSLALTGKGHLTDYIIKQTLYPVPVTFLFHIDVSKHPNTMVFKVFKDDDLLDEIEVKSVGGGDIIYGNEISRNKSIYPHHTFLDIAAYAKEKEISLYEYVREVEGPEIDEFLSFVWQTMKQTVEKGLVTEGVLPGDLEVKRKASTLIKKRNEAESHSVKQNRLVSAYAFAASEENAAGGIITTAPTCGASGVLPAVLYFLKEVEQVNESKLIESLAVAGLIGNLIKHNATISGAVGGCQAEVGSACSMAAGAHAYVEGQTIDQIEYAAEVAMEHHLGLTCDPIDGYVQIPCIERNAVAAIRAINASGLSYFLSDTRKISFDMIVETMYQTGLDMHPKYKETAEAGMAYFYKGKNK